MTVSDNTMHPLILRIRECINKRSTVYELGVADNGNDYADWNGYAVCNKDTQISYTGRLRQKVITLKKDIPEQVELNLLWKLVLRCVQEGPVVRKDDDNPNKWEKGKPRAVNPLKIEVFDSIHDLPEKYLKRIKVKV